MNPLLIKLAIGIGVGLAGLLYYRFKNNHKNYENEVNIHQEDESKSARCSICLNDFINFSRRLNLPCGHPIHRECGQLLFVQRENSCAWCRRKISPEFLREHFPEM